MTTFKKFLESKELGVNIVRPLSDVELFKTKRAIELCLTASDFLKLKIHEIDMSKVSEFHAALVKAARYFQFAKVLKDEFDEVLDEHGRMAAAWGHLKNNANTLRDAASELKAALFSGKRTAAAEHRKTIDSVLHGIDHHVDAPTRSHGIVKRTFTETPSFFQTTRLLKDLSQDDYDKLRKLDLSKQLFTHLDFPNRSSDKFDYVMHFLLQLTDSPKPRRETSSYNLRTDIRVKYAENAKFKELLAATDRYLYSNDVELIPTIVALIKHFPEIQRANEQMKRATKQVYRGLYFSDDYPSDEEIIEHEHERKYVATSNSRSVAKNFALQKGHLEDESMRRSQHGVIIHYDVSPEAILFDTRVIDTAYVESEILIDATKARVAKIEEI